MKELIASLKSLVMIGLALAVGFVLLNFNYWWKQAIYTLNPDAISLPMDEEQTVLPPDKLRIPALGIEAPLVYTTETDEQGFQKALENGVVHYPNTALPGELGNAYFFGHSSDFAYKPGEYKTVFALLPRIKQGEIIEISAEDGRNYQYEVTQTLIVRPDQTEVLSQGDNQDKMITLQTSYPVGTAISRFLVIGRLIE